MLLNKSQRNWLFYLFLVLAAASAALEGYIVVKIVDVGNIDALKTVLGALNGTGLALLLRVFIKLLHKEYLSGDSVTENHLSNYFEDRLETVARGGEVTCRRAYEPLRQGLVQTNLLLLEELLKSLYGSHHYQLSVFTDREHPEISSYYDSSGHDRPRSYRFRAEDPDYYRKAKYHVVRLLDAETPDYVVISDTRDGKAAYSFINDEQRSTIGSTVLFRFAVDQPGALIVVSDQPDLFRSTDGRLHSVIAAIGMAIRMEWQMETKLAPALRVEPIHLTVSAGCRTERSEEMPD